MKKLVLVMAALALLCMGATSAMADNWMQNFSTNVSDSAGFDQIQIKWLSGDTFNGFNFWYGNAGWAVYNSPTLFIATSLTGPVTGADQKNIALNFTGLAHGTSFLWEQFNGSALVADPWGNVICTNPTQYYTNWTYAFPNTPGVRLSNPVVPEPSGLLALAGGIGCLIPVLRRKR